MFDSPDYFTYGIKDNAISFILILNSVLTLLYITNAIFRYLIQFQLKVANKKFLKNDQIQNTSYLFSLIFEIIFFMIHPFYFLEGVKVSIDYEELNVVYINDLNNVLVVFVVLRLYYFFRYLLYLTNYHCIKAYRLSKLFGVNMSMSFNIRCLQTKHPFLMLGLFILVLIVNFSYMLKIVEGPMTLLVPFYIKMKIDFNSFIDCFYGILITLTTVGYGDIVPTTSVSKFLNIVASILGVCFLSVITILFEYLFTLTEKELQSFLFINRNQHKKKLSEISGLYILSNLRFLKAKNAFKKALNDKHISEKTLLELQKELEVAYINKIRKRKKYKFELQNFIGLYESFEISDSIKQRIQSIIKTIKELKTKRNLILQKIQSIKILREKEFILINKKNMINNYNEILRSNTIIQVPVKVIENLPNEKSNENLYKTKQSEQVMNLDKEILQHNKEKNEELKEEVLKKLINEEEESSSLNHLVSNESLDLKEMRERIDMNNFTANNPFVVTEFKLDEEEKK